MTLEHIAYCGLYCAACSFKLAHDESRLDHLLAMPERYDPYKRELPPSCPGCRLENQCGPCEIRDCAREKDLLHCGLCDVFPCEHVRDFAADGAPHHAEAIDNLTALKALGPAAWLAQQSARWTCACGAMRSWYLPRCRNGHASRSIERVRPGDTEDLQRMAELSQARHATLRETLPFLPARTADHFLPKLRWMAKHGEVLALRAGGTVRAFLGGFILDDFRNAGPGAFCPDWCHGLAPEENAFATYRALYRELAPRWKANGAHIHALALYATDNEALEALSMTGFGRIMMDAARPADELLQVLETAPRAACSVRRATAADAPVLAELNAALAAHIAGSPILLPRAAGRDEAAWAAWLDSADTWAYVSLCGPEITGYIRAEAPQEDVSDAVHSSGTLGINGMFIKPSARGQGHAQALLEVLVRESGRPLISVDCETTNPEAYAFWSRYFRPVAWSVERRT